MNLMRKIYIKKNNLYLGHDFRFYKKKSQAIVFSKVNEAEHIIKNNVSIAMRHECVIEIEEIKNNKKTTRLHFLPLSSKKANAFALSIISALEEKARIANSLDEISSFINKKKETLEQRHKDLTQKLSILDKEITDIVHYIEFNEFSEKDGYKAYKLLHDKAKERRAVKTEKYDIEVILDTVNGRRDIKDCRKYFLEKGSQPTYTPRALPELFQNVV